MELLPRDFKGSSMHPDVARKTALDHWSSCLDNLATALQSFKEASKDPQLTRASFGPENTASDAITLESLCSVMQNAVPRLDSLKSLYEECCTYVRRVRNYSKTMIPVNRLPPELLSEIFLVGVRDDLSIAIDSMESDSASAISAGQTLADIVSQVCRGWRDVSMRTSELWSVIDMRPWFHGQRLKPPAEQWLQRSGLWLSRSQKFPLSIIIDQTWEPRLPVDHLLSEYRRWRNLTLAIDPTIPSIFGDIQALPEQRTLCSLVVIIYYTGSNFADTLFKAIQWKFTCLTCLRICGLDENTPWTHPFPESLTVLHLHNCGFHSRSLLDIGLRTCSRLEYLSFSRVHSYDVSDHTPIETFTLPSLDQLFFAGAGRDIILARVFVAVKAPNLSFLSVAGELEREGLDTLSHFITASPCTVLRSLTIATRFVEVEKEISEHLPTILADILTELPDLEELQLLSYQPCIKTMLALIPLDQPYICPKLKLLKVTRAAIPIFEVASLVENRVRLGLPMAELHLSGCVVSRDDYLQNYMSEGVWKESSYYTLNEGLKRMVNFLEDQLQDLQWDVRLTR